MLHARLEHIPRAAGPRTIGRKSPLSTVVPTPSTCAPTFCSVRWKVGIAAITPIEPVMVVGLAQISSAAAPSCASAAGCRHAPHRHNDGLAPSARSDLIWR